MKSLQRGWILDSLSITIPLHTKGSMKGNYLNLASLKSQKGAVDKQYWRSSYHGLMWNFSSTMFLWTSHHLICLHTLLIIHIFDIRSCANFINVTVSVNIVINHHMSL